MRPFAERTGKENAVELTRWIVVLPAAVLAGFIVDALAGFVASILMSEVSREGAGRWARHLIFRFPGGLAYVIAGAKTAPRLRRVTAIVLVCLAIALSARTHGVIRWGIHGDSLPVVVQSAAVLCGAAYIFNSERSKERSQTS